MATFVLVPGFWLGAWAWDEVAAELRGAGHQVFALTPGGVAERADEWDVTVESRVADVVEVLAGLRDVVLVGHSGAGAVVAAAAERARDRLAHLVFVDTGPLPEGVAFIDFLSPHGQTYVRGRLAECGNRYPMPDRETLTRLGVSTEGIGDTVFALVRERATAEPGATVTGSARRGEPDPTLPKTVVACGFTEADARAAIEAGVLGFAEMAGPEWEFVRLPTGHWPMFSAPVPLADVLSGLSGRYPG